MSCPGGGVGKYIYRFKQQILQVSHCRQVDFLDKNLSLSVFQNLMVLKFALPRYVEKKISINK